MVRRLWSGFWAAVMLVGIPVVLVRTVGNPLPARRELPALIQEPLTEQNIYAAIAVTAWLIWAGLLYTAIATIGQGIRRSARWLRRLPRLPLPTPLQGLAGGMLGAVAVTAAPTSAVTTPPAVPLSNVDSGDPGGVAGPAHNQHADAMVSDGVELPDGGWLPSSLAQAVQAAAVTVWWRRRRHYDPTLPGHRAGEDLGPLPQTARAVQAALTDTPPATDMHLAGDLAHDLPAGGVGLTGPGAAAAVRGVLLALLLSHRGDHPRVVTTADDLDTLLDGPGRALPQPPGLHVAHHLADACAVLDAMVVDHPGRPVTIITTAPEDGLVRRLAALLTLGAGQGLTGIVVGPWPHGSTWHVEADGRVDAAPGRLTTLTAAAAVDLLTLTTLRNGEHPTGPTPTPISPAASVSPGQARLRLTLLGRVTVTSAHGPVVVRRTAATQILVFLALHPAGATTAELCEAIWPQLRPHTAAGRFYTTVSELRGILRTATGGPEAITHTGGRYLLDHALVDTDVNRLLAASQQAATAPDQTTRQAALRDVIDLYRGELAAGHNWPWLAPRREHIRREVINAHVHLANENPDQATRLWRDAARIDPVNEHLHQRAVQALIAAGDHHAADALHADHARHLAAAGLRKASDQAV